MLRIERESNSIPDKLRRLAGEESWADVLFRSRRQIPLKVCAEEIDFTRAEVFIADINKKTRGAFAGFTVEHLIYVLYDDFLLYVRENLSEVKVDENTVTMEEAVISLSQRRKIYFPRVKKHELADDSIAPRRWAHLEVRLKRDMAQRGEVFLYDASTVFPKFEMTLEELLSILLCDFVAQLRRGNQKQLVSSILDKFYSHDFD